MEERAPPSHEADEKPTKHGRSLSWFEVEDDDNNHDNNHPMPLVLEPAAQPKERNTLVIQIPKDQIYRIPPPENAKIVEAYRNPEKKKVKPRFTCCLWVCMALILMGVFIEIPIFVIKNVFTPESTIFSIMDVRVTNKTHIGYEFTLKSKNPSEKLGITISSGGGTSLIFKSHKLSTGKFPELSLEGQDTKNVHITLNGTNSGLPKEIGESMNDKKSSSSDDHHVSLELKMDVFAKFNLGILNFWGKNDMTVDCNFKMNSLKNSGNKILSQNCNSKIK